MHKVKHAIWFLMDKTCELTGHDLLLCWNAGDSRIRRMANRIWLWSWDLDNEDDPDLMVLSLEEDFDDTGS